MIDRIILVCISFLLPLVLIIANRLLDRTEKKEKDNTIAKLTSQVSQLVSTSKMQEAQINSANTASELAQQMADSTVRTSDLMADAKKVESLSDALEIARRQVNGI